MYDEVDDELSQMYEEDVRSTKVFDSSTFKRPIKHLRVRKPLQVSPSQTVAEAIAMMNEKGLGCVVVSEQEKLVGIFTERDVLKKVVGKIDAGKVMVKDVMTPHPEAFQPEDSIAFVLNAMHVGGYRHVPIVDENNKPIAVVSVKDIVAFILDNFPEDVLNLPPEPIRKTEQREGA
ncbi:MAG TPA: CBS domain-containing protein [Bacteroidota bacterium]|nr:CBS domain-containing protein [Bacteroidota bacterium]